MHRIRTERQIAIGCALLAAFSLAAVWLDPAVVRPPFSAADMHSSRRTPSTLSWWRCSCHTPLST